MNKNIVISSLIMGLFSLSPIQASSAELSEAFSQHTPESTYKIGYEDYNLLLKQNVLDLGRSYRQKAKRVVARTGTRLKAQRNLHTALEGNRFFFKNFRSKAQKQLLTDIRISLETLPNELALKEFNKNVQLAYWLNLYNVALLEKLVDVNTHTVMKDYLYGEESILNKKILTVSGEKLSLNNIRYDIILPNFGDNKNVIYGFFQGVIGGPNLRNEAYTGDKVLAQLKTNGQEFVNSNRGVFKSLDGSIRVSDIYFQNKELFPNASEDLKSHILTLIDSKYREKVSDAKDIKMDINDMSFANLSGGFKDFGERAVTGSAQMGSMKSQSINQYIGAASNNELLLFRDLMMNSHKQRSKITGRGK